VVGDEWKPQIRENLPVTDVLSCDNLNAKALRLQTLQLPDMAAGSGPTDGTCIMHRKTDELLVKQRAVSDRQPAFHIQEGPKNAQVLNGFFSHLIDVC
jgi:hypothetical protein